jgi:hypothetical protein
MEHEKRSALMAEPVENPPVLITFEGLFIGYYDNGNKVYQLGVLPASQHQFSISIQEFARHPDDFLTLVSTREFAFHDISTRNQRWIFEVEQASPPPGNATLYYSSVEPNRLIPPDDGSAEAKDYRWALSLDNGRDFPDHYNNLTRQFEVLNPIIHFKQGLFYNRGFIGRVYRKPESRQLEILGTISETVGANLETIQPGANIVLKIDGSSEPIFKLSFQAGGEYRIDIKNSPPHEHDSPAHLRSHFPFFYLALHTSPARRYDLRAPFASSSGSFALLESGAHTNGEQTQSDADIRAVAPRGAPNPYRCGIGTVTTPLP